MANPLAIKRSKHINTIDKASHIKPIALRRKRGNMLPLQTFYHPHAPPKGISANR